MEKYTNLKEFMGSFIKKVTTKENEDERIREAHKKKREEHSKKFYESDHGKHDKFDPNDFIY